jgi:hypothetical protein
VVPRRKQKTPQRLHDCLPKGNALIAPIIAALSPVPPVLSGADQAGLPASLAAVFAVFCSRTTATAAHPRPRVSAFPNFMRREHYGNFSVADSAARVLACTHPEPKYPPLRPWGRRGSG